MGRVVGFRRYGPEGKLTRRTSSFTHSWKFVRNILHMKLSGHRRDLVRRSAAGAVPAHARSGDRVRFASSFGKSERFDGAIADFAKGYAGQNERDHADLCAAVKSGRLPAEAGA